MLTRRAGFASCAICAVTGFVATDASAALQEANRISEGPPASGFPFRFHMTILRRKL